MCVLSTSDPPRLLSCSPVSKLLRPELEGHTLALPFSESKKEKKKKKKTANHVRPAFT